MSAPEYIEVTAHAINRASLRALAIWQQNARPGEGLHAWLHREARIAFTQAPDDRGYRHHLGLRWAIERVDAWPILKTIVRDR